MGTTTIKEVEGAMPTKNDFEYVRALDDQGNPIRISKADVAKVVEELLPVFGNNKNGFVDNLRGGVYCQSINTSERVLLKVDIGIGNYDALDITLFYNYRMVRFILTVIGDKVSSNLILDNKTNASEQIFNVFYKQDLGGILYIEYPKGVTQLHLWSIKKIISQWGRTMGSVTISSDDITGLSKITI